MLGVGIGALALIIILSAFNGIQDLVEGLYSKFDADIRIEADTGKTFLESSFPFEKIESLEGIKFVNSSLEDVVIVKNSTSQAFITLKGVEDDFLKMSEMDSLIWAGGSKIQKEGRNFLLLGLMVADQLHANIQNNFSPLSIYAAKPHKGMMANPENAFRVEQILLNGIFSLNPEIDSKYAICHLDFARKLLDREDRLTAVEIDLVNDNSAKEFKEKLQGILGGHFIVKTRYELNELLFKSNNSEKWGVFMILGFILIIATLNIIGSITILILDKKKDIKVLSSMGASKKLIERTFFLEGLLIAIIGGISGLILGILLVCIQSWTHIIPAPGLLIDHYPVILKLEDIIMILLVILSLGCATAWIPSKILARKLAS